MVPPADHDCSLLPFLEEQQRRIEQLLEQSQKQEREIAQLKKALIGPKSERTKMPSVQDALGKEVTVHVGRWEADRRVGWVGHEASQSNPE